MRSITVSRSAASSATCGEPPEGSRTATTLSGEIALVTGATSDIGAETAAKFAEAGANVGIAARRTGSLEDLKAQDRSQGDLSDRMAQWRSLRDGAVRTRPIPTSLDGGDYLELPLDSQSGQPL
nr:SDR family NAD(P)-dependent oxidoreductase [Chthonobacter rhizosphaerae]